MAGFVSGDVGVTNFPFDDDSESKKRPVLVLAGGFPNDSIIICMITSSITGINESYGEAIESYDFTEGGINRKSYAIPHNIRVFKENRIIKRVGRVGDEKMKSIYRKLISYLRVSTA